MNSSGRLMSFRRRRTFSATAIDPVLVVGRQSSVVSRRSWEGPTGTRLPTTKLHLVLEVVGRHFLEDLRPLVRRDVGQIVVRGCLALLQDTGGLEHLAGHVNRALRAQRQGNRIARPRID